MAFLKNSVVAGDLRVTGTIFGDANLSSINANNTGLGTDGQILKSTGTGIVWSDANISGNATNVTGIVAVANGGTGTNTLESGKLLIGNGTSAVGARTIKNMTTKGNLGWTAAATDIYIPTVNTLAYWDGKYNASTSNLAYCNKGAFGTVVTYNVATPGTKDTWGLIPVIGPSDGVMEVGKYIDFHTTDGNTADYDVRITAATTGLTISGTTSGTFSGSLTGNASTATKLATARTLTIGSSGKTFDGSADVSWTLADIGAAASDHNHDSTYVNVSGDTMTGGLTLSNGSSAYNDKGIIFTNGSRIGENGGGDLGIYAANGLYIKPSSPTASSSTEGIRITSNGLYPCVNNTELLGLSNNKWSNVYATTFTGNLNGASNANIYLTSATAAGTAAKTASYTGFSLLTGSSIYIKFDKTNTAESPTLNIEGTGAKEIWYKGAIVKYQGIATGITYHMMYDGSKWQIINNIIPQMGTCSTTAGTTPKTVTCPGFILHTGATIKVKFTVTNTHLSPTLNINSTGAKPINWIGATNDLAHRLVENHIYEFVYDGTNYNIVAPIARHYATSGAAPVMYTQQDYDNYVDLHGGPPTWAVGDTKTEAVDGVETLALGNSTDYHMAGGLRGKIILYGAGATNYTTIYAQANGSRDLYLPNYAGKMYLIHAGDNNAVGTSSKPVYVAANGRISQGSTYAGGTAVTLNGTSKSASTASFYAPTAAGTANQVLKSTAGTPEWTTVASVSNEVLTIVS